MTRFAITSLLALLWVAPAFGQEAVEVIDRPELDYLVLTYKGKTVPMVPAFEDYSNMLSDACEVAELSSVDCLIYPMNAEIENAIAFVANREKLIVYDRRLSTLLGSSGAQFVLAHELGHHYCEHFSAKVRDKTEKGQREREADAFAGAVMQRLGYTLSDISKVQAVAGPYLGYSTEERIRTARAAFESPDSYRRCRE